MTFWLFIKSLVKRWLGLVTSGILALILSYGPKIIHDRYQDMLAWVIFGVGFIFAAYSAWKDQYLIASMLKKKCDELKSQLPKYELKVLDVKEQTFSDLNSQISAKISNATQKESNTPAGNRLIPMPFEITKGHWAAYISELEEYRGLLNEIQREPVGVIRVKVKNIGKVSDKSISIVVHINQAEFLPDFYEEKIKMEEPSEPDLGFGNLMLARTATRQGFSRHVEESNSRTVSVEFSRLHAGEEASLVYYPIFIKNTAESSYLTYEIKSDELPQPVKGKLPL